ncbi:hypothetical protein K435DRAFT_851078 [Dendrothele bispora CBS 962.96]|uniref:Major facilitator superfamily (MFS) profile domain-containing protein n=1 Tax=Dendrothele bispora (strain CBS 962.96) TaxID=1314807 RepID=A0A4S8MMW5_DENBC|nr:hypothetical protein K435DRAFT_879375 [Dendrothele bispora CBS 962.96]THV04257.1 hypothetical protein K435DRAFT_851078 [Dendrothele bispora CBS 962.96]
MPADSFFGALLVRTQLALADKLGRKKSIMLASLIWVLGSILQCAAVTEYQSEITAPAIHGLTPTSMERLLPVFLGVFRCFPLSSSSAKYSTLNLLVDRSTEKDVLVVEGQDSTTNGIIVYLYLFNCSFAITMGPVSWTYPAKIVSSIPSPLSPYIYRSRTSHLRLSLLSLPLHPKHQYPLKIRGEAVSLATASKGWIFNIAHAWAVPPSFEHIA